jgi:succinyl-diaminopimelate desuccinylase
VVGEPTNPDEMGDMIKIGRRGSLSGTLRVDGVQGHVAYPHLADNPLRGWSWWPMHCSTRRSMPATNGFRRPTSNHEHRHRQSGDQCDPGANKRPPSTSASTTCGRRQPGRRTARPPGTGGGRQAGLRPGRDPVRYSVEFDQRSSPSFLTRDDALIDALSEAVREATGRTPALSTTGGTSDARFIKDYCPVVEFGLVGKTMHMVDERVALSDLESLTGIYELFIERWFERQRSRAG